MGDWRQMGHAARRRMGAPSNHFGAAMANHVEEQHSGMYATSNPEQVESMHANTHVYEGSGGHSHDAGTNALIEERRREALGLGEK